MHLLIPYIRLPGHPDPAFDEYTYGDGGQRARKLKKVKKGEYLFFHTTIGGKKLITAYYVVDRVMDTVAASQDSAIRAKYRNPHIKECLEGKRPERGQEDVVVFGDPITSQILRKPLVFDRRLAKKLGLHIQFPPDRTETQAIASATRSWRELSEAQAELLLEAIAAEQESVRSLRLLSSEEVAETLERDIEQYLANNPTLLGEGLKVVSQQEWIGEGRLDLLLEDKKGNRLVVEVKYGRIGRDAIQQIRTYMHEVQEDTDKKVSGAIVCAGVMPAYEEEVKKQKDIQIFVYGWDLRIERWSKL